MEDFDARQAELDRLHRLAASVSSELVGLASGAAKAKVALHPGLILRFATTDQPLTADFRYGRITAFVRDGVVTDAGAG